MGCNHSAPNRQKARARDVLERVTLAIETLCVGEGDVRSRLKSALAYHLLALREEDFPHGLGPQFRNIVQQSTKYDDSDLRSKGLVPSEAVFPHWHEGLLHSTMRRIRRSTGSKIARDIWDLYSELRRMAD